MELSFACDGSMLSRTNMARLVRLDSSFVIWMSHSLLISCAECGHRVITGVWTLRKLRNTRNVWPWLYTLFADHVAPPGDNVGHMSVIVKFCPLLIPGTITLLTPRCHWLRDAGICNNYHTALSPAIIDCLESLQFYCWPWNKFVDCSLF